MINEGSPEYREVTWWEGLTSALRWRWVRFRRKRLPYLVWWGDELDVRITFAQDKLNLDGSIDAAFQQLYSGTFRDIERQLSMVGIGFDKGMGELGRDWEWDWSLEGPVSVVFHGRAKRPERRLERPRPKLVVSND